jgi:hypothetical protein
MQIAGPKEILLRGNPANVMKESTLRVDSLANKNQVPLEVCDAKSFLKIGSFLCRIQFFDIATHITEGWPKNCLPRRNFANLAKDPWISYRRSPNHCPMTTSFPQNTNRG